MLENVLKKGKVGKCPKLLCVYSKGEVARARWRGGEVARRGGEAARSDRRGGEVARSEIGEARSKVP